MEVRWSSGKNGAATIRRPALKPVSDTYCLNLVSLIGSLCSSNYIPLFAMTSAPLRVEIQLASSATAITCSAAALSTFSLTNVEYVMNCIELSDNAIQVIRGSTGGNPLQFVFSDYSNIETLYK